MGVLPPLARLALVGLGLLGMPACARGFQLPLQDPSFQQTRATAAPVIPWPLRQIRYPIAQGLLRALVGPVYTIVPV
jgi:hypothetical protein